MLVFLRKIYMYFKYKRKGLPVSPFRLHKELKKSQYWSIDKIAQFQNMQLNKLLLIAINNVAFYSSKDYKKILPNVDKSSFIKDFPVLTKGEVKDNYNRLINRNIKKRIKHSTTGSTGNPLTLEISGMAESYRMASKMRFFGWYGVNMFDKNILIWRVSNGRGKAHSIFKKWETRFLGKLTLDVFQLDDDTVVDYVNRIEKFKPKYIRGYKSGIYELSRLMEKHNLRFSSTFLKVAFVTSETLLDAEKEFMEKILGVPIANEYGAADGGLYANQCPEGSLHINDESVLLYTKGENMALVTELFNYGMPLINYLNEDRISLMVDSCSCGRNLRVINEVEGRTTDFVLCKDGYRKHSMVFTVIFNTIQSEFKEGIKQFRVIQDGNKLIFLIIPSSNYGQTVDDRLIELVNKHICNGFDIKINVVDQIPREKSGKLRYFIRK